MKKVYVAHGVSVLSTRILHNGSVVPVEFMGGAPHINRPAQFITSDTELQKSLEKDSSYGKSFTCITKDVVEEAIETTAATDVPETKEVPVTKTDTATIPVTDSPDTEDPTITVPVTETETPVIPITSTTESKTADNAVTGNETKSFPGITTVQAAKLELQKLGAKPSLMKNKEEVLAQAAILKAVFPDLK